MQKQVATQSLSETEEPDHTPIWSSVNSVVEWVVLGVDQTRWVRFLNREGTPDRNRFNLTGATREGPVFGQ